MTTRPEPVSVPASEDTYGLSDAQAAAAGSAVLALGSHAIGVLGAGSDVDLVCVLPYFVDCLEACSPPLEVFSWAAIGCLDPRGSSWPTATN